MLARAALVALMLMMGLTTSAAQTGGQTIDDLARRAAAMAASRAAMAQAGSQTAEEIARRVAAEMAASKGALAQSAAASDLARQIIADEGVFLRNSSGELAFARVLADQVRGQATTFIFDGRSEQGLYDRGQNALDNGKWEQAIEAFDQVIQKKGAKVEGAMYWKAYAQNRLGRRTEALATLDAMLKAYPGGRWANDAKALQVEVRQASGQPVRPEQEIDEDLKLIALNSLLQTDADKAVPMLEALLKGNAAPKLKERALFVLAQVDSPQASAILTAIARGQSNPDLQRRAVRYLGMHRSDENVKLLVEIYKTAIDTDVKRQVIQTLTMAGQVGRYEVFARGEAYPMIVGRGQGTGTGTGTREFEKATQEQRNREEAIRKGAFGMMGAEKTGDALLSLYKGEKDPELKKAALQGLFMQQNATALVQIARQETDPQLKKDVVQKLSMMKSKEATDYLMELLKK